jgi:hypothetical protein
VKMTVERARALMGREADRLSDEEIARQCRALEEMARLHVKLYDQHLSERRPSAEAQGAA